MIIDKLLLRVSSALNNDQFHDCVDVLTEKYSTLLFKYGMFLVRLL